MAYNRNYNGYNGRNSGGYSRQYQQPQPRKRSGAKFVKCDGTMVVSAWRVNRKGELLVLYARPYKSTSEHEGKRGAFLNYFVTITNKSNYNVTRTSGLLYPDDKRLLLPDFGEIVTANGKGGTWCSAVRTSRR
ncbi:MAG: hypothetical protein J6S11_08630 [Bacteroidaceae bacterium]|nr:hypothetical protein [Bacteroidaceae bacterium]